MFTINAMERQDKGKGASRRLRNNNYLPAIIYGDKENNICISLDHNIIMHLQMYDDFYKEIMILVLNGIEKKVKIQSIQRHPFKPKITHIDFITV
ncbi:50S ribosomal protein L25 [Candidatus Pantoea edessiphila]|uniref:Large ribosomal subunit protein bL25 n=1 Tax=Candidatus Pantoea edessiphila TaxID=2044610 RepID=A0A2P5T0X7_9GAMM|nr:50S ribosomal protein L25 [Candidatus Pantoea edessiphila]PPI88213.1 50S ribosomal protein L25 [Candidatus Pantoea edessiphila]